MHKESKRGLQKAAAGDSKWWLEMDVRTDSGGIKT